MEMSKSLETYVAYLHNFIGGDMMTSSSPYDPVFYAIHAQIDMFYWSWQQRGQNKYKFPAAYGNIPMIPFNIPPWAVFDSEENVCVTYAPPSTGGSLRSQIWVQCRPYRYQMGQIWDSLRLVFSTHQNVLKTYRKKSHILSI